MSDGAHFSPAIRGRFSNRLWTLDRLGRGLGEVPQVVIASRRQLGIHMPHGCKDARIAADAAGGSALKITRPATLG
jgi:hypothetical protein